MGGLALWAVGVVVMSRALSCPTFVGRSEELAALRSALAAAGGGAGGLVIVEGDAGVGKTRLIESFAAAAAGQETRVLCGSCLPLVDDLPYAPILEILHELDEVWTPSRPDERHRFFRYVADALAGGGKPTLVVVEDLHWADTSTCDLLVFLARALRSATVLLVATVRSDGLTLDGPLVAMLTELTRGGHATRLRLRPFDQGEVTEQLAGILGTDPPAALARRLHVRADGNPFFVEELLNDDPQGRTVPPTVSEMVVSRLSGLSQPAELIVRAAAVIGRTADHGLVAAVCDLPVGQLEAGLREALARHLLVITEHRYAFRHALIQEAVYSSLLPGERARLHERVAATLTARAAKSGPTGPAPDMSIAAAEVAHHWDAAGCADEALAASMRAGTVAETLAAPAEAHTQYERVLRLWPHVPDAQTLAHIDRPALLARTAEVASLAGRYERAGDLIAEALEMVGPADDPVRAAALLERLGRHRWLSGRQYAAWAAYEEAGRLVADQPQSLEGAQVLAALAQSLMLRSRLDDAIGYAREAIETARAVGSAAAEGHASNTLGTCLCSLSRPQEGIALVRRAVTIALDLDDAAEIERGYNNLVESLTAVGNYAEAVAVTEEAITQMRRCGIALAYEPEFHGYAARALTRLGRWDEAERAAQSALTGLQEAPGSALAAFVYPHALLLETRRGHLQAAAGLLDRLAKAVEDVGGEQFTVELARQSAELALTQKRYGEADTAVREGLRQRGEALHSHALGLTLCALGARTAADAHADAIATGRRADREAALAKADQLVEQAHSIITETTTAGGTTNPDQIGYLLLTQAERSRLAPKPDPHLWAELTADRAAATDPYLAAYARFRQAEAILLSRGPRSKAKPLLREAAHTATRLHARPLMAAIEDLAQRAGINLTEPAPKPNPPAAPHHTGFDLTPREKEILNLLAQGLSNKQIAQTLFISTKTASVHVSAIIRKLGVTSRIQAATIAQQGQTPPVSERCQ
jgi:DNA-binding CsgD family transcriptional regulator/SLT domain-containing protein